MGTFIYLFLYFSCIFFVRMLATIFLFGCLSPCVHWRRRIAFANRQETWLTKFDPKPLVRDFAVYNLPGYKTLIAKSRKEGAKREDAADEVMCSICVDTISEKQTTDSEKDSQSCEILVLPCNIKHCFHIGCIRLWLKKSPDCPLCKKNVFNPHPQGIVYRTSTRYR